jgi:hypothetical protein
MDLRPIHHPEAESSSSVPTALPQPTTHQESSTASLSGEHKSLRTSARVKAAKQKSQAKGKGRDLDSASIEEHASSSLAIGENSNSRNNRSTASTIKNKRTRDLTSAKGKDKEAVEEIPSRSNKRCVACDVLNRILWLMGLIFPQAHVVPVFPTHLLPSTNLSKIPKARNAQLPNPYLRTILQARLRNDQELHIHLDPLQLHRRLTVCHVNRGMYILLKWTSFTHMIL